MRVLLSLTGIIIVGSTYLTGFQSTGIIVASGFILALCLMGLFFFLGKSDPKPCVGDVGYLGTTTVTVVSVFDSFFSIPEPVKLIHQPDLEKDHHLTKSWVVAIDKRGKAYLSPYFKPVKSCSKPSKVELNS